MTSAQVVETSVTNNSPFQNYPHPDNYTIQTTDTPGFKPFTFSYPITTEEEVLPTCGFKVISTPTRYARGYYEVVASQDSPTLLPILARCLQLHS